MAAIRDAPFGRLVRLLTKNEYFQYPEGQPGFRLPDAWIDLINKSNGADDGSESGSSGAENTELKSPANEALGCASTENKLPFTEARLEADVQHEIEANQSVPVSPKAAMHSVILVDWYSTDDPENPHNWSNIKRALLLAIIFFYTFIVYATSAIYTSSVDGIREQFDVSTVVATLGLSLYVLRYGIGPMFFSPMSEIPAIGRNPVYVITMFLFVIISIPTALVSSFPGLVVLRFLQGFFGSPCLASGAASISDMYSLLSLSYALLPWVAAQFCAPALGPLLSGFSVPVKGWRWSLYESIWLSAPVFITMFIFLPETSSASILLRRAAHLRKIYNNPNFMSKTEIQQHNMRASSIVVDALIKPTEITIKDPAILFMQLYTAIIYATYYSSFEVFPMVYPKDYHMNLGDIGLIFLAILVACILGVIIHVLYLHFWAIPRIMKFGPPASEERLVPGLIASVGPVIGLFIFAWTARASIPWIAPTIGITLYATSVFIILQCIFIYIPLSYPQYAASLFAANDLFRSALACGSVLFAYLLFGNLGVARGVTVLGGLSVIGVLWIWLLYLFGAKSRALSKFAVVGGLPE